MQALEEEDGESVYSHYEEDAETGEVTRHLLKKNGAAHQAHLMHAVAPPAEDESDELSLKLKPEDGYVKVED